jgi:small subunit ribosomal protein S1
MNLRSAQIEQDSYEVGDTMTMEELLEMSSDFTPVSVGSIVDGTVVEIRDNEILVDVGAKYEGVVKLKELEDIESDFLEALKVGDKLSVHVAHLADQDGYMVLSLKQAFVEQDWEKAESLFESGEVVERRVVGYNKGGVIVKFGQLRGFVPSSQLIQSSGASEDKYRKWAKMQQQGKVLVVKVIEVERERNRLILSERQAIEEQQQHVRDELLNSIEVGEVRTGRVTRLFDFGAFVELGGLEGLIHISELSWAQVGHPKEVVRSGENVEVHVLRVDKDRQRIALSLKKLQPEPWSQVGNKYEVGQVVTGIITRLTDFGAFARIDNSLDGLIHISEMSDKNVTHPNQIVKYGEELQLRIISLEPDRKRMGLSIKQVQDENEVSEVTEDEMVDEVTDETEDEFEGEIEGEGEVES